MATQAEEKIKVVITFEATGDQGHHHKVTYEGTGQSYASMQEAQGALVGGLVAIGNSRAGIK